MTVNAVGSAPAWHCQCCSLKLPLCSGDGCPRAAAYGHRGLCRGHYYLEMQPVTTRAVRYASALATEIDWAAVAQLADGEIPESYTAFERREAVRRLFVRGLTKQEIARRVGVHNRQVYRDLAHPTTLIAR